MLDHDQLTTLLRQQALVLDGGLATELEKRNYDISHPLWSALILDQDPMVIKQVHLDFFLAGANVAITASYQASVLGFAQHLGLNEDKAVALMKRSVMLARLAREEAYGQGVRKDRVMLIAGSVGPYGAYLADGSEYRGDYVVSKEGLKAFHRQRIRALVEADVDLLAVETMPQLLEIEAVLELIQEEFAGVSCWVSCTLRDEGRISDGSPIEDVVKLVEKHRRNVVAFGFNCVEAGLGTKAMVRARSVSDLPGVVYPNTGEEWDAKTNQWCGRESSDATIHELLQKWTNLDIRLLGGCCKTGPEHIMAIARALT